MGQDFTISVNDVDQVIKTFDRHLADFAGASADLARLAVPAGSYGQIGGSAAGASRTSQDQLLTTLQALAMVLQKLNERVRASARGYETTDQRFAADFRRY